MKNRLYREDCKTALQTMIDEGMRVDLIYLDPPFNSSRTYNILFRKAGSQAQQKAFDDMWLPRTHPEQMLREFDHFLTQQTDISPTVRTFLIKWITLMNDDDSQDTHLFAYLIYMTERLILMKKVLKESGSIYYHCDPAASHYIKIVMDKVFGRKNFQNEIIWSYSNSGRSKKRFARKHDIILFYSVTEKYKWTKYTIPISEKYLNSHYRQIDDSGKRCRIRVDAGKTRIYYPEEGMTCTDAWNDIPSLNSVAKERLGYPTQKPVTLLDRIINASSKRHDIVLDPFCGCGTTLVSAYHLNRHWIGIDISGYAVDEVANRLAEHCSLSKTDYHLIEGSPDTLAEYTRLTPYEKQDWLIRRLGGYPNPRKSGDKGIDGELTIHLGTDESGNHTWGKLIFSVKTGTQRTPAMIRELLGTMHAHKADMGALIIDAEPTPEMEKSAEKAGMLNYKPGPLFPVSLFDRVQILTAREIIAQGTLSLPYTMMQIKTAETSLQHNLFAAHK